MTHSEQVELPKLFQAIAVTLKVVLDIRVETNTPLLQDQLQR